LNVSFDFCSPIGLQPQRTSASRPFGKNVLGAVSGSLGSDLPFAALCTKVRYGPILLKNSC
jgi:hypothetical protein